MPFQPQELGGSVAHPMEIATLEGEAPDDDETSRRVNEELLARILPSPSSVGAPQLAKRDEAAVPQEVHWDDANVVLCCSGSHG